MASSDEEGEIMPDYISGYHFVNCNNLPVTFALLPLQWDAAEVPTTSGTHLFLYGTADDGVQTLYKKAVAWKFELCYPQPEIYVLLPNGNNTWIKLLKPRKSYEEIIKPVLTVVHCLHYVKYNPLQSREAVWSHIKKTLSVYEVPPSEDDLPKYKSIINDMSLKDEDISKSKYFAELFSEPSAERKSACEENLTIKRRKLIVEEEDDKSASDDEDDDNSGRGVENDDNRGRGADNDDNSGRGAENDDNSGRGAENDDNSGRGAEDDDNGGSGDKDDDIEDYIFDHVCAFCDNGGELLTCEGRCIRSFHPTIESGRDSHCESLGYTSDQVQAIQTYLCKNCQHKRHQCFACGSLGISDACSGAVEVFPCVSATCGHFFHPKCVSKLVFPSDETQANKIEKEIADGEPFTCPAHKCFVCKQVENKKVQDMQFAVCRRCPKAYHRKCLPRSICFQTDDQQNILQRAWDFLLPGRILIYCMDHKMIPTIGTPRRDHILFPFESKKDKQISGQLPRKERALSQRRSLVYGAKTPVGKMGGSDSVEKERKKLKTAPMLKLGQTVRTAQHNYMCAPKETYKPSSLWKNKHKAIVNIRPGSKEQNINMRRNVKRAEIMDKSSGPSRDEIEERIDSLMKSVNSSFDENKFIMEHKKNSIQNFSSNFDEVKSITEAKVERAVKAVKAALKKLEEGHSLEDAKAICEPGILSHIFKWKNNLGTYLSPFLHGTRYTSFGRHFTKLDKFREIVNRLRWYVQDGDTIVDFCCGSNDFSCMMKEELQRMGKTCHFKNYDIIQPKKDFNFEKRNWMSVEVGELPEGSKLIMGFNPPFAVAYEFLCKALTFRPKLLIVTVPKSTKRLDERKDPYDIVWEDHKVLSGKSFYLPGSVDVQNQQMDQWNNISPPLYLWSRPDWTAKHKAIAFDYGHISQNQQGQVQEQHQNNGHISKDQQGQEQEQNNGHISKDQQGQVQDQNNGHISEDQQGQEQEQLVNEEHSSCRNGMANYLMEETHDCYGDYSNVASGYGDINNIFDDVPEESDETQLRNVVSPLTNNQDNVDEDEDMAEDMAEDMELSTP